MTRALDTAAHGVQEPVDLYNDLRDNLFVQTSIAEVTDLVLAKPAAQLHLKRGQLYCSQSRGSVHIAVFVGEGILHMQLPDEIERSQVRRFLKADSVAESFGAALFYFTDDTYSEISSRVSFLPAMLPKELRKLPKEIHEYLLEETGINLRSRIAADVANDMANSNGFFIGALEQKQAHFNFPGYLLLSVDPQSAENVGLFQFLPKRVPKKFYTICSFAAPHGDGRPNVTDLFEIEKYQLSVNLEKNGKAEIVCQFTFVSQIAGLNALSFDLFDDFKIDSVLSSRQDTLSFIREKNEAGFTVFLNESLADSDSARMTVYYSGKLLALVGDNYVLKDNLNWYPRSGYLKDATYTMTYTFPKNMQLISVGSKVSEHEEGGKCVSNWVQSIPVITLAFSLGYFDSNEYEVGDLSVQVYSNKGQRTSVRDEIGQQVAGSLFFLQSQLDDYPYKDLKIVETPGLASNGYPGLLFLTTLSFSRVSGGQLAAIRAHETSHQWWGNLVGWQSYRDQWLSEALAEYTGAILTHFLTGEDKDFWQAVNSWRNDLLEKGHVGVSLGLRRFGFSAADLAQSDGIEAGPICLGRRLGSKHAVDYFVNVYEKGAYVLHMLRTMLRDFESGDDSRFLTLLKDYVQTYHNRRAKTADFEQVVSRHFDKDMSWFFEQWIYGTDVPFYRYDFGFDQTETGNFVTLKIAQEEVSPTFRALIPVTITFENHPKLTTLIDMHEPRKSVRFGPYSETPLDLIFNDFSGVLARVKRQ